MITYIVDILSELYREFDHRQVSKRKVDDKNIWKNISGRILIFNIFPI